MQKHRFLLLMMAFLFALLWFGLTISATQAAPPSYLPEAEQQEYLTAPPRLAQTAAKNGLVTVVYTTTQTDMPIPDNFCINPDLNSISVPDNLHVYAVEVGLNVSHPQRGDLKFDLISPDATRIPMIRTQAGSSKNFDVWFAAEALTPPGGPPGEGDHDPNLPYYEYTWRPEGDLHAFDNEPAEGDWSLFYCDNVDNALVGELNFWTIKLLLGPARPSFENAYLTAPLKVEIGSMYDYKISVFNSGSVAASNLSIHDPIPWHTEYISNSVNCDFGTCSYDASNKTIYWVGELPPYYQVDITFAVSATHGGEIGNTAVISHSSLSQEQYLSTTTWAVPEIYYHWDFELDDGGFFSDTGWQWGIISVAPPMPPQGGLHLWGTNLYGDYDDSNTNGILLSQTIDLSAIPPGTKVILQWWQWYALADGDQGILSVAGTEMAWINGRSAGWEHRAIDLSAYAGQSAVPLKWGLVPNQDGSTDLGWYLDNISIHAGLPEADILVVKQGQPDQVAIGETLLYTVTVYNEGPYTATDVVLYDYLPAGVNFVSLTPGMPQTYCDYETSIHKVYCYVEEMFPGEARAVFIETTVAASGVLDGQLVNYARAYANESDPIGWNNTTSLATDVSILPSDAPRIDAVSPQSAVIPLIGKVISIYGANFSVGMRAFLGSYELNNVVRVTQNRLEARVPQAIPPGTYDLRLLDTDAQTAVLRDGFTVMADSPPEIGRVEPNQGLNDIPNLVDIYGQNFSDDMQVVLSLVTEPGIALENIYFVNSTRLMAVVPRGLAPGLYDLTVSDSLSRNDTLPDAYTVLDSNSTDDLRTFAATDFWNLPAALQKGSLSLLGLTVHRQGGTDTLEQVKVDFYLGDPGTTYGTLIASSQTGALDPNSTAIATTPWTPGIVGRYTLYAVIDPLEEIPESDDSNNVISRTVRILPPSPDLGAVQVNLIINQGVQNTQQSQVYLNTTVTQPTVSSKAPLATNFIPAHILYIEYQYAQNRAAWVPVKTSGWLPFTSASENYPWRLAPGAGAHYIQAWVANARGQIITSPGLDVVNRLLPEAHLAENQVHVYRYQLLAGSSFLVRLSSLYGDADLYLWTLNGVEIDRRENNAPVEEIEFTVPVNGTYQLEVEGHTATDYRLEIIPLGNGSLLLEAQQPTITPNVPTPRGRGTALSDDLPGEQISLPETPDYPLFLPSIVR
ncbi:MAG: DUF11 domain-containing protein [Anaerolineales bacterium]|nr:DUF11 domain-containing protein [Anaerolineales bacterium]